MYIFNYKDFLISESVVSLSGDVIAKLLKVSEVLTNREIDWINKIIDRSGLEIESPKLDKNKNYSLDTSNDLKYFNIKIFKPDKTQSTQKIKIGKALKSIVPDIPDDILSNITSALNSETSFNIFIVEGEDITKYYTYDKIDPMGTLGRSCMNEMDNSFFKIYSENKGSVKMAILLNDDDMLIARALLWNTNIGWVMDRVYYSSDRHKYKFIEWAKDNNYNSIYDDIPYDLVVKLDKVEFEKYPYLDTFKYISFNRYELSNDDIFSDDDQVAILEQTNGSFEVVRNYNIPFSPVYSLSYYKSSRDLLNFIENSIDDEKFIDAVKMDFIENSQYVEDFLDTWDYYIKYHIDKFKGLSWELSEMDKDNYEDVIREIFDKSRSVYDDLVNIISEIYHKNKKWRDIYEDYYGELDVIEYSSLSYREKEYWDNFIGKFCSLDILNSKLESLYKNDHESYLYFTNMNIQ